MKLFEFVRKWLDAIVNLSAKEQEPVSPALEREDYMHQILTMQIGQTLEFGKVSVEHPEKNKWLVTYPSSNYWKWSYSWHRTANAAKRKVEKVAAKKG